VITYLIGVTTELFMLAEEEVYRQTFVSLGYFYVVWCGVVSE